MLLMLSFETSVTMQSWFVVIFAVSDGVETTFSGLKKKKKKPVSNSVFVYLLFW